MKLYCRIKRKLIYLNRLSISGKPRLCNSENTGNLLILTGKDVLDKFKESAGNFFSDYDEKTRVLIKVNLNSSNEYPASVSNEFLLVLVSLLREHGVSHICVSDCSGITHLPTSRVIKEKKMKESLKGTGVGIKTFDYSVWAKIPITGKFFKHILLPNRIYGYDKIINLANLKSHQYAGFSAATKNLVGFMHPIQRGKLHKDHLCERTAELTLALEPDINIIDARKIFITGGPDTGLTVGADTIIIGTDLADTDYAAYSLLIDKKAENGISDLPQNHQEHPFFRHMDELKGRTK